MTPALTTPEELTTVRRAVYWFLLAALDRPDPEQHAWFGSPEFRQVITRVCEAFGVADPPATALAAATAADHEARYIACFDVGLPHPPVPLLASHYNRREPVTATIHEHILFYRRFGFQGGAASLDSADHLRGELGFLLHLDALLAGGRTEARSVLCARRDFLNRQVGRWVGLAAAQAESNGLPPVYRTLLGLLAAVVERDREMTAEALAGFPQEEP